MRVRRLFVVALIMAATASLGQAQSRWVSIDAGGKLKYAQFNTGDRIADFSFAGYRGGGVALPHVPGRVIVSPTGQDDTAAIQQAIDAVSKLPLADGFRGAVTLTAGTFRCATPLSLTASGVVLRGAGTTAAGTTIMMTGAPHLAISMRGSLKQQPQGESTTITDAYVASSTNTFNVADASSLHVGDTVLIQKPVTDAWLHLMGMDHMGERNGKPEHWIDGTLSIRRLISAVTGKQITVEVPLMDSYDARFLGVGTVKVQHVVVSGQIAESGVEGLRIIAPKRAVALAKDPEFDGLNMNDCVDCWMRDVAFEETTNSVNLGSGTERVTLLQVDVVQHVPVTTPAKPFDFSVNGSQILLDRCSGSGDSVFYIATQGKQQGPVVALHCRFLGDGHIQPHQRWSTGLLVDNCEVPGGGTELMKRGQMGSGHGWTIGWSVVWNSSAQSMNIQQPPASMNWSIGNKGTPLNTPQKMFDKSPGPELKAGIIESSGKPVSPPSLYLAQLAARLGPAAVEAIGYPVSGSAPPTGSEKHSH